MGKLAEQTQGYKGEVLLVHGDWHGMPLTWRP